MLLLGATVDIIGPRKALLISLGLMLVGRVFLTLSPEAGAAMGLWSTRICRHVRDCSGSSRGTGFISLPVMRRSAVHRQEDRGDGVCDAVRADEPRRISPGVLSPPVRKAYGITGVFWVYVALTAAGIAVIAFHPYKRAMREARAAFETPGRRGEPAEEKRRSRERCSFT